MTTLHVQTPHSILRFENGRVRVAAPVTGKNPSGEIPPSAGEEGRFFPKDLDRIVIVEDVQVTSRCVAELLRAGVPLVITDRRGRFLGTLSGPASGDGALRLSQFRNAMEPGRSLGFARRLVETKILNQIRLLQRLEANRPGNLDPGALPLLRQQAALAATAQQIGDLLGHEGAASKAYFQEWARFLPEDFPFVSRSTRPPLNPVNAVLSFTSVILYNTLSGLIQSRGLDPAIGCLHATDNRRHALALDLMEPFRPAVVEPFTLRLFCHRILNQSHFEPADGGIHLNKSGRCTLLWHWEKRLRRPFTPLNSTTRSTMLQEFEARIINYKRALDNPAEFAPFRMP